jgi:hypothetical protein
MGQLSSSDHQAVFEWVALNADALVEFGKAGSTPSNWAKL